MVPPKVPHPEQLARRDIDAMLEAAGWAVQDRKDMNLAAAPGVAIRELQTSAGPADYMLFLRNQLVGVIEAKKAGVTLSSVEAQTREYAAKAPKPLQVPVRPLPFLYESTAVETWFTNGLDPEPRARSVAEVERRMSVLDALDATIDANLARCGRLRQSILKRAFEGRLVPPELAEATKPPSAPERLDALFAEGAAE